jgi:putative endonuclease
VRRVYEHRSGFVAGFTQRYGLKRLIWFEGHDDIVSAIQREKRIKNWARAWKVRLIERMNPEWEDLYPTLFAGVQDAGESGPLPGVAGVEE